MRFVASAVLIWVTTSLVAAELDPSEVEFFESKVRPILVEHCYECHSEQADEPEGGLFLDSREGWQIGGDSGAAIVPGDVEDSLIVDAVRYTENVVSGMPPTGKLEPGEIKAIETWVLMGAPDPRTGSSTKLAASKAGFDWKSRFDQHWSWRPITRPKVPKSDRPDATPIDAFIGERLTELGLVPAEAADRRTLIRRLSFDLIGMPPTLDEIERFVNDSSAGAVERLVDRLLASPLFGEKWARHWMDLVRYAETYGHEFDYPIENAHQYRDYLIRAFNEDVPYDQIIREHIAGDLIDSPRRNRATLWNESVIGTGFWYLHEATHAPTDVLGHEATVIDNQVDVMSKTFLGLTVACARCHDHKFDAISTKDYYALTAFLQNSCRTDVPLDAGQEIESATAKISQLLVEAAKFADTSVAPSRLASDTETVVHFSGDSLPPGWSSTGHAFESIGPTPRLSVDGTLAQPGTVTSDRLGARQVGTLRSPTFTIDSSKIHVRLKARGDVMMRVVVDHFEMVKFHRLLFGGTMLKGKELATDGGWQWRSFGGDLQKYRGHQAYIEFVDSGHGSISIDQVVFEDSVPREQPSPPVAEPLELPADAAELVAQASRLARQLPDPTFVIGMSQGTRHPAAVYIRGAPTNLGDEVPPRNLDALGGREGTRLDFADQITSDENPLVRRVAINRLWHHLFGVGIVPTTDDFGPQGKPPSHPELLDWLASDFSSQGWSIKRAIRNMVLSRTYRQASVPHRDLSAETIAASDPANTYLHRSRVRRLPGESIRDAMLGISGRWDAAAFGSSVATHRTPFMEGRGNRPSGPLDGDGRRSVYLSVYRNFLNPFLLTFDMPAPFGPQGRRGRSNVPAQSLAMMNDPLVIELAGRWADRADRADRANRAVGGDMNVDDRIRRMYAESIGDEPTTRQLDRLAEFLRNQSIAHGGDSDRIARQAWADLAHAIWNLKAFTFLR